MLGQRLFTSEDRGQGDRLCLWQQHMTNVQVTRDWLLMEMGSNANVDDQTFLDIAQAANLPESCRPQVQTHMRLYMVLKNDRSSTAPLTSLIAFLSQPLTTT
jgi:hypothetical protein